MRQLASTRGRQHCYLCAPQALSQASGEGPNFTTLQHMLHIMLLKGAQQTWRCDEHLQGPVETDSQQHVCFLQVSMHEAEARAAAAVLALSLHKLASLHSLVVEALVGSSRTGLGFPPER